MEMRKIDVLNNLKGHVLWPQSYHLSEAEAEVCIRALEQEPKTGHWIEIAQYSDGKHKIECSECGNHIFDRGHANSFNVNNKYKYCPNCGAKMFDQEGEGAK